MTSITELIFSVQNQTLEYNDENVQKDTTWSNVWIDHKEVSFRRILVELLFPS